MTLAALAAIVDDLIVRTFPDGDTVTVAGMTFTRTDHHGWTVTVGAESSPVTWPSTVAVLNRTTNNHKGNR